MRIQGEHEVMPVRGMIASGVADKREKLKRVLLHIQKELRKIDAGSVTEGGWV